MILGNKLQDIAFTKEELRIKAKREANEQRRQRFQNARARVIGLDIDALDSQVMEKERMKSEQKEADRLEKLRMMEIEKVLEVVAEEENMIRKFQKEELKKSWEESIAHKKSQYRPNVHESSINPDDCGLSSAQIFAGEDRHREERSFTQKSQMRSWIQEQLAEKSSSADRHRNDLENYHQMQRMIDEAREGAEREERAMRKFASDQCNADNAKLLLEQRARRMRNPITDATPPPTDSLGAPLAILDEDTSRAFNENGNRILRKDMFKGYSEPQRRRIQMENEMVRKDKLDREQALKREEREWAYHEALLSKAMELTQLEEKQMKNAQTEQNLAILRRQMEDQQQSREEMRKTKFGTIQEGFFQNFGTSAR